MTASRPEISLVMPCYNEEVAIRVTAPELVDVFSREGVDLQLVLVDNGSSDRTGQVIDELVERGFPIKKVFLEKNQGYGGGILAGLRACDAPILGYLCADGQVSAEDTLIAYKLIKGRENRTFTKVRRRFRKDSWKRKIVSIIYNGMMQVLYGGLGAIDINGSPKIFSRETLDHMELESTDWFLDPEIIVKAKYLGLRIIEVDVEGIARRGGSSNVNIQTCFEFLKNIFIYRTGDKLKTWRNKIEKLEKITEPGHRLRDYVSCRSHEESFCMPVQSDLSSVRVLEQNRFEDSRGFLQKVLTASQCNGNPPKGEVYVVGAKPGESRGNHYHLKMGEWFTAIQGNGEIQLCDPKSKRTKTISFGAGSTRTVYVPPGIAHSIVNRDNDLMVCVAWAEREHDPEDVYAYSFSG